MKIVIGDKTYVLSFLHLSTEAFVEFIGQPGQFRTVLNVADQITQNRDKNPKLDYKMVTVALLYPSVDAMKKKEAPLVCGYALCYSKDGFCKAKGRKIAIERLIDNGKAELIHASTHIKGALGDIPDFNDPKTRRLFWVQYFEIISSGGTSA